MPGEFEPHDGCWMVWPERPDNWRLQAGPAQEAFAAVAEAIAVSEPVTMAVSDGQYERCRAMLSPAVRVLEMTTDDAWMRDIGPSFVLDADGRLRGSTGTSTPGVGSRAASTATGSTTSALPEGDRIGRGRPLPGATDPRGRLDPCRRRGDGHGDRRVPPEPQPQSRSQPRADRGGPESSTWASAASCGWATACLAMRPTAMSTIWPASPVRGWCS